MTNNIKQITNNRGFTLIEIMVTIAIIAVLSSISWVGFQNYQPSMALNAVTRDLTTDLRLAQQLAITQQINHGIFFNTSANTYQLEKFSATTQILFSKSLPHGISFCQITGLSGGYATFNPYGSVEYSGSVCLINNSGQSKIINIKPSGFVEIQD